MRLSATYIERSLIFWGQIIILSILFVLVFLLFASKFELDKIDISFFIEFLLIALFFLPLLIFVDYLILFLKFKPRALFIKDGLYLDKSKVDLEELKSITPVTYNLGRMDYKLLEFQLANGEIVYIICKPQSLINYFKNKPTKTLTNLKKSYPVLAKKIKSEKEI